MKRYILAFPLLLMVFFSGTVFAATYPDPNVLTEDTEYNITTDETYTGSITYSSATRPTLTKKGAGNMILGGASGSQLIDVDLIINEGKVSASRSFAASNVFGNGVTVTVNSGGTLQNTTMDAFGYGANAWTLRLNEGGVYNNASGGNESWKNFRLELAGGTMQSTTTQMIHFLSSTEVYALAATGATVENPTVSTISAAIAPRNGSGLKFDVAEDARLDVTGKILVYGQSVYNIGKTGVGTMVLSNAGNSYLGTTTVSAGTLKVLNDSLKTSSRVTVASGATLELGTAGKVGSPVSVVGTGLNHAGAIHFSSHGEVNGALTLTGDTSVVLDSGVTGKLTGGTTGAYTMTVTNGGTLGLSGVQGQTTTVVQGGTLEFLGEGSLSGSLTLNGITGVTKSGTGVFSLAGAADVTSLQSQNISIMGGTLELDIANINAMTGTITTSAGTFLGVKNSGTTPVTFAGTVTGEGGIRKSGTGTVILNSAVASKLNAVEGTLQLGTATTSFTGSADLVTADGAHMDYYVNGSDTNALGGQFSGTGTITKWGTGTVTMTKQTSETNPLYSQGNLTISEGTVKLIGSGQQLQFSHSSVVTVEAGATLEGGAHDSLGYGAGGADGNFFTLNIYGQLLNSYGNESLRNCDINLYGGTIQNSSTNSGKQIDVLSENMRINAKAIDGATAENPTISTVQMKFNLREDVMGDLKSLYLTADTNAQMNVTGSIIQSKGNMGLVKEGAGVVVLSGAGNAYAGTTTVSAGTLRLLSSVSSSSGATVANGATLELGTGGSQTFPVTLAESGTVNFAAAATLSGAVTLTGNANVGAAAGVTGTISGNLGGDFGLTKVGMGTVVLSGVNTHTSTAVSAGTLKISNASALGAGGVSLADGAELSFNATGTYTNAIVSTASSSVGAESGITATLTSLTSPAGSTLTKTGAGTVSLTNPATIRSAVAISAGTFALDPGAGNTVVFDNAVSGTGTLSVLSGTVQRGNATTSATAIGATVNVASGAALELYVNGVEKQTATTAFTGRGTVEKYGTGTLQIGWSGTATLSQTADFHVHEGTLAVNGQRSGSVFGNGSSVYVYEGATLSCLSKDSLGFSTHACDIYLYGGTLQNSSSNETLGNQRIHLKNGSMTSTAQYFDLLKDSLKIISEAETSATVENPTISTIKAPLHFRSQLSDSGMTFQTDANSRLEITGTITQDTARGFTKTGDGTLYLGSESNALTGTIYVNGGTLEIANDSLKNAAGIVVANGANLEADGPMTLKSLDISGSQTSEIFVQGDHYAVNTTTVSGTGTVDANTFFSVWSDDVLDLGKFMDSDLVLLSIGTIADAPLSLAVHFDPAMFGGLGSEVNMSANWVANGTGGGYYQLTAGLPEPASWTMLLLGLVLLFRRRK